jgi:hypothetical protein
MLTGHGDAIFWVADAVEQGKYEIKNFPGKENLADYQSKHHTGAHTTKQYVPGTFMRPLVQSRNYLELVNRAL